MQEIEISENLETEKKHPKNLFHRTKVQIL